MQIVAIDFETADFGRDSACAVGLARVVDGAVADSASFLIRPPRLTFHFTYIHRIAWDDVRDEPSFADRWPEIAAFCAGADYLAAHNAAFDRGVLRTCCAAADIAVPDLPFLCTVKAARAFWNIRPTKLPDVCAHFGIPLDHHDAASDALACARIVAESVQGGHPLDACRLGG